MRSMLTREPAAVKVEPASPGCLEFVILALAAVDVVLLEVLV